VAAGSGNPREAEATAWAFTRLGIYSLQSGDLDAAGKANDMAVGFLPDFAPALLLRGRIFGARAMTVEAVKTLEIAAQKNPLPEYLWALSDALRADGRGGEAATVDAKIVSTGRNNDPRTFALYLSTRRVDPATALELARAEIANRQDIFSRDALAWAELQNGDLEGARENIALALAEGTQDARLFYHAAAIAAASNDNLGALSFSKKSEAISQMLLPSERADLGRQIAALTGSASTISSR
jgi:tetratricopeptide (TPR) repeat protein